jgi:DNA-binding response OmpR family regulator
MAKKQILIADDDQDVLEVIKAIMEHEGYRVRTARDGEQAFKLIRKQTFDAVILDIDMPREHGIKVLQLMRRSSKLKNIPVMMITGDVQKAKELEENGKAKLANDCMIKPFNTRDLTRRVRALVNPTSSQAKQSSDGRMPQRSRTTRI